MSDRDKHIKSRDIEGKTLERTFSEEMHMKQATYHLWIVACLTLGYFGGSREAIAQIVPDGTLPINSTIESTVTPDGNTLTIDGGTAAGGNLFHSFQDFNVPIDDIAHFNNALTIDNIITRVTGGNISNIDGLIRANGTANLFLINPAGLVFGENASLDLGGSFVGSTAEVLQFEDGSFYSAVDVDAPPLLTISVPVGLQFGPEPGDIVVRGHRHKLRFQEIELLSGQEQKRLARERRPSGLEVLSDQTLALVGGEISLIEGNLTAEGGRIELGSVAGNSTVTLAPIASGWQIGYEGVEQFGDISLSDASSLDTSGPGAGSVQVQGRSLFMSDGSAIVATTLGDEAGEAVTIRTTDSVTFEGVSSNGEIRSGILADVEWQARGNGPTVNIETGSLQLIDGTRISASTRGQGRGGDLRIDAAEAVEIRNSGIVRTASERESSGDAGHFTLETDRLTVLEGSGIETTTKGQGDAGNVNIVASHVEVRGEEIGGGRVSRIEAATTGRSGGNAGDVTLRAESLQVRDGALVSSTALGGENGGNLIVIAPDIEVSGETMNGRTSRLIAEMGNNATGNGGMLNVQTDRLIVSGGGVISVAAPQGEAGILSIIAREIEVMGTSLNGAKPSSLIADTFSQNTGESGTLSIRTERLAVREGGSIQASTLRDGFGGNLTIEATESIELTNSASIETTTGNRSNGRGGNITIGTGLLSLLNGGRIATTTKGGGDAGNLTVVAGEIDIAGVGEDGQGRMVPSRLEGQVNENAGGNGGLLSVEADRLTLRDGGRISAGSFSSGNAGTLDITASQIELSGGQDFFDGLPAGLVVGVTENGTGDAGSLTIQADRLIVSDGMQVSVSSQGEGAAGNLQIHASELFLDRGILNAETARGNIGDITLNTSELQLRHQSQVTTNAMGASTGGNITILTDTLTALENSDITANADASLGGRVNITAQGIFGTQFREEATPGSDITATSELGPQFNGTVNIQTPDVDPSSGLLELPDTPIDATALIGQDPCRHGDRSEFVNIGRGGVPPTPRGELRGESGWAQLVTLDASADRNASDAIPQSQSTRLIEAQGWTIAENGEVILTANPPTVNPQGTGQFRITCQSSEFGEEG